MLLFNCVNSFSAVQVKTFPVMKKLYLPVFCNFLSKVFKTEGTMRYFWAAASSCYLDMLDKLQKRVYKNVGPSLAPSPDPLTYRRNVASISLFFQRCYFSRNSFELTELVPLPHTRGRFTHYSNRLHDFLSLFLDVIRMPMSRVYFLVEVDILAECFPLIYDLDDFKSRINGHLTYLSFF